MKILSGILAVALAVVVGVAVFAMLNLRALIAAHQDQLVARVARVVGRPITVGSVVPSWWPLGVRLRDVTVAEDPAFGSAPFLVAEGAVMSIRPWPLVHGRIEASGVVLDRPRLTLVRDRAERWNVESLGETPSDSGPLAGTPKPKERRHALRLPLEWVVGVALSRVQDGTIVIEDRAHDGQRLTVHHLRLDAEDVHLGATARVRVKAGLFTSAAPDVELDLTVADLGQNDVEHAPFTARLQVADADLEMLAGWLGRAGGATGRARRMTVDASGTLEQMQATVAVESVDPQLHVGGLPLGAIQPIALTARLARTHAALAIEDLHATLGTLVLDGKGEATERPWKAALAIASTPGGTATVTVGRTPIRVTALAGRVVADREGLVLEPLRLEVDAMPFEVRGWITGLDPPRLDVRVEGRPFAGTCAADLLLEASGAARARVELSGLDLAPAVAWLAPELRGRIEGRANGAAVLTGRVAGGTLVPDSLAGDGSLTIAGGRLRDVNLPDLVVEQIEGLPLMPQLVSPRTRARYAELFASRDTVVDTATLPFVLGRGRLSTERASFENPAYQITGKGWVDEAQQLRFNGTVLLGASVSRTLRDDVRAAKYFTSDDGRVALPFVARGRAGKMWVEPDGKRLRERGLTALLGKSADGDGDAGNDARRERRAAPLEDQLIERLERMLKP